MQTRERDRDSASSDSSLSPVAPQVRAIAAYLPQFHPVPENDDWWGPGFTEWTNVASARRLFPGHYQPHVPGELGFYDLRLPDSREQQADLARAHGIEAFCYWHYWFAGRRMLHEVFDSVLESGAPDFPFCLAWANASWARTWDIGGANVRLIEQTYPGEADHRAHFEAVLPAFHDPRYVRVDGKPLFYLYRPHALPNAAKFADLWRRWADEAGLPGLFLIGERRTHSSVRSFTASQSGLDAVTNIAFPPRERRLDCESTLTTPDLLLSEVTRRVPRMPSILSYGRWSPYIPCLGPDEELSIPVVFPNWDNTPRQGREGLVLHGSTPELFRRQVELALDLIRDRPPEHRLVFVRSWNEWAEGNHMEPDRRFGRGYLEAFREAVSRPVRPEPLRAPSN